MTINSLSTANGPITQDRKANIDNLLKKLRIEMNELSEQGNDITQKMWNVQVDLCELISDQQITTSEDAEDEQLISKRKASTSSSEPNSSSGLNSSELNSGSSTNESNSNEDINESMLKSSSSAVVEVANNSTIAATTKTTNTATKKEDNGDKLTSSKQVELEEFYRKIPALEILYATVSKNLKHVDLNNQMNNQLNDLITNSKNAQRNNGRTGGHNRLNGKFNRKASSLSARNTPVNQQQHPHYSCQMAMNGTECNGEDDTNRKSFQLGLHNNMYATVNGNSPHNHHQHPTNMCNNYYSDADSISYEAIDYLGSNSIDSGYKSSTPDYHYSATNLIERRNGGRFSFDAASNVRSASSSSFHQYAGILPNVAAQHQQATNLPNDKLFKQYQELIAKSSVAHSVEPTMVNYSTTAASPLIKNSDLMMNKTSPLISSLNEALNQNSKPRSPINKLANCNKIEQQALLHGRTFKSALALKSSNPTLNDPSYESDYCTVTARYNKSHRHHLSQSEQYLDSLNEMDYYVSPYLMMNSASHKSRHLFKNRSNLNLEQYLHKIKQQNEILKQEISEGVYAATTVSLQQPKVVKRKLPQISNLYGNRSELVRNKLLNVNKHMHSSDMRLDRTLDEYQTNKYEHQARFKSIYMMNNRLRRQKHLSASIEQVSNLDSFYDEIRKCTLSNSLDGDEEAINEYQMKANLIKQKNLMKQINSPEYMNGGELLDTQQQKLADLNNEHQMMIDKLYSQVQKYQQKSSSTASIYYQDYLDSKANQQNYSNNKIEAASSLTTLTGPNSNVQQINKKEQNNRELNGLSKKDANSKEQELNKFEKKEDKKDKHLKTRSTDDLYKSMTNLMNNKYQPSNDMTSKRRAFKLASPLRTLSKAFSSEANDLFRMKELAKSKFVNLIDNFASSTNSSKKSTLEKTVVTKSPIKAKKCSNRQNGPQHSVNSNNGGSLFHHRSDDPTSNHYVYQQQQIANLQSKPLPDLPIEHLYEELKTTDQQSKERRTRGEMIPGIRINYCKQRSTTATLMNGLLMGSDQQPSKQTRSLEESSASVPTNEEEKLKLYSKSLEEEYEEEIIRKVNSDDIITKIENVISNIDTMLNNKENLTLEYKNVMS